MNERTPTLPIWPFIAVDLLFLTIAAVILGRGHHPLLWQEAGLLVLCGALGSWSFLAPFLRRNADAHSLSHAELLAQATGQIQKLSQLAAQISCATDHWGELQTQAAKTSADARQISERMQAEAKVFAEFMQRASEGERAHLRVEVEKLRRAETERLQVLIHVLDHIFALFQAARHSGQPALIEQIGQFQNTCRELARRIGLVQTAAQPGEAFDAKLHQLPENAAGTPDAQIAATVMPGYTFQGQLMRRPMVALQVSPDEAPTATA